MNPTTKARAAIAMLAFMLATGLLFATGLVVALMQAFPEVAPWIPVGSAALLVVAVPFAGDLLTKIRARERLPVPAEPASLRLQYRGYHRDG